MSMKWQAILSVITLSCAVLNSLGGTATVPSETATGTQEDKWEYSISTSTYFALHSQDYVNPNFTADHDWLHLEARYNYEALKTGSLWLGYNFSFGKELVLEATPMIGGVFGNSTGIAPGYAISISYKAIEFFTQGEYFFDAGTSAENFFYTWSELSCAPVRWFKVGLVVDRTKTLGSNFEIRRGPLVGFKYKDVDLTTYWLSPGSQDATFIFAVTCNF
jgi:hypothetical protein